MQGTDEDTQHLQWLSIGHYVVGGLLALVGCFPMIHLTVGLGMLFGAGHAGEADVAPLRAMGGIFAVIGAAFILGFWAIAAAVVFAGRSLAQRQRRIFCMVMAGIECILCVPFGTVLGVFTLVVLQRPGVQAQFERS